MRFVVSWLQEYLEPCLEEYRKRPLDPVELVDALTMTGLEAKIVPPDSHPVPNAPGETVVALDLTPNRPDCMSILGVAREFCIGKGQRFVHTVPELPMPTADDVSPVEVQVLSPDACPLYRCREVRGIAGARKTPDWMALRLRTSGLRPVSLIVDVMNYVMLELGQPLHAFDLDHLCAKKICVGLANGKEVFELLDGRMFAVPEGALLIGDGDKGAPVALAGTMGAKRASVQHDTCNILIEAAFFAPQVIRKMARMPGLYTESARRFEKGVDFQLSQQALDRAVALLADIAGGKVGCSAEWRSEKYLPSRQAIVLRRKMLDRRLGLKLAPEWVGETLAVLGCEVKSELKGEGEEWTCIPPSFRFDLEMEVDLVEEVARLYGYERIGEVPGATFSVASPDRQSLARMQRQRSWSDGLVGLGYSEVITLSFGAPDSKVSGSLDPVAQRMFKLEAGHGTNRSRADEKEVPLEKKMVDLLNPLTQVSPVMRATLWFGLIDVLSYNLNRGAKYACFFEVGKTFTMDVRKDAPGEINEELLLGGLAFGPVGDDSWNEKPRERDYYDVKGDLESLLRPSLRDLEWQPLDRKYASSRGLLDNKSAGVYVQNKRIGILGAMQPEMGTPEMFNLNLSGRDVFLFEIYLDQLPPTQHRGYMEVSHFPTQRFDVSLRVPADLSYATLYQCIKALEIPELHDFSLLDVFSGKDMAEGERSMTIAFVLQGRKRTLTDTEGAEVVRRIADDLQQKSGVKLRYWI